MDGSYQDIEVLRERMRDAAAQDYATGGLSEEEFERVAERIALVETERDVGRLGLVRFALSEDAAPGPATPSAPARRAPGSAAVPYSAPPAAMRAGGDFTFIGTARRTLLPEERGASSTILLGDVKLDCRACESPRVDLDVVCLLGDIIVEVPFDAVVVNDMTTILGEFKDKSFDPAYADASRVVRLSGFHLIGDLKIKRAY